MLMSMNIKIAFFVCLSRINKFKKYNSMPYSDRSYHVNEITENCEQVEQPSNWNITLKNHQLSLIHKCATLENEGIDPKSDEFLDSRFENIKTNIGIIGDKVGSGKSYCVLGLIESNTVPMIKFKYTHTYGINNINVELKDKSHRLNKFNTNILVVPHSIIKQWEACIKSTGSENLSYYIVNTTKSLSKLDDNLKTVRIILVSGTFYKKVYEHIIDESYHVNRVIFDEVDSMNTPNAKHIPANFYWFVSASYKNILNPYPRWNYEYRNWENSYMISSGISNNAYAKNIFMTFYKTRNQSLNRLIDNIVMKNNDEYVERSFSLPEINKNIIRCKDSGLICILNGVVHNNIIQCLNAGDITGAVSYINQENVDTESNIVEAVKQGLTIKLNNIGVELRLAQDTIYINEETKRKKIEKLTNDYEMIRIKMQLIEDRINESEVCMICMEKQDMKTITKCCNNAFCFKCLSTWLKRKPMCPLCKGDIHIEKDLYVVHNEEKKDECPHEMTKIQYLQTFLNTINATSKILIFSEYDNSFIQVEELLDQCNIKYARLKGNSINKNVNEYKTNDLQVLMVNSNAYGSGLNLENTTDVVLFHKFDNDIEKQIIGRAQRPGRVSQLNVWYLLNDNEISRHS